MQAVISMRARGKGAFALRADLKAVRDTVCELKRFKENEHGTVLQLVYKISTDFETAIFFSLLDLRHAIECTERP